MKKYLSLLALPLLLIACGGGSGNDNPPIVAGNYEVIDENCEGMSFSDLEVIQQENNIIITAKDSELGTDTNKLLKNAEGNALPSDTSADFVNASGSVNNDGDFEISTQNLSCEGQFVQDTAIADCRVNSQDCQLTLKRI